jgi:hypothetical protein
LWQKFQPPMVRSATYHCGLSTWYNNPLGSLVLLRKSRSSSTCHRQGYLRLGKETCCTHLQTQTKFRKDSGFQLPFCMSPQVVPNCFLMTSII